MPDVDPISQVCRLLFEAPLKVIMTQTTEQSDFDSYSYVAVSSRGARLLLEAQQDPAGALYKQILEKGIVVVATEGYELMQLDWGWTFGTSFFNHGSDEQLEAAIEEYSESSWALIRSHPPAGGALFCNGYNV